LEQALQKQDVACSFVIVGTPQAPSNRFGMIPDVEALHAIAVATGGALMLAADMYVPGSSAEPSPVHQALLCMLATEPFDPNTHAALVAREIVTQYVAAHVIYLAVTDAHVFPHYPATPQPWCTRRPAQTSLMAKMMIT
jgi:hypothetical protein